MDSKLIALAKDLEADVLYQRLQPEQDRPDPGRQRPEHQPARQRGQAHRAPRGKPVRHHHEAGQGAGPGVAYLEDGTMVVVEQGEGMLNRGTDVVVTSILQTPAGGMIFATPKGNGS